MILKQQTRTCRHSIRGQIILISTLFTFAAGLIVVIATTFISIKYLRLSQRQSAISDLHLVGNEIDQNMTRVITFSDLMVQDPTVRSYLQKAYNNPGYTRVSPAARERTLDAWHRLDDEYNGSPARSYINRSIIATSDGSNYIQVTALASSGDCRKITEKIMNAEFSAQLRNADSYRWIGFVHSPLSYSSHPQEIIPILRPVESPSSSEQIGWYYTELMPQIITDQFKQLTLPDDAFLYLTFPDGGTFQYQDSRLVSSPLPEGVISYTLTSVPWTISILPSNVQERIQKLAFARMLVLIFLLLAIDGTILLRLLQKKITAPVMLLSGKLKETGEGVFSYDPSIEWDNEFGTIGRGINALSENIQLLMDRKVHDEREKQELKFKILQSQINPHFMYNTLNTIKWMATIQGADGIAEMLTALSHLLKNVSKGQADLVPLSEEFSLIKDYFIIMKYRYGGLIQLNFQLEDPALLNCRIPRFSLQPIVENSIFHGIEPKGGPGTVNVHVFRDMPDTLKISIQDDGIGMDAETIDRILSGNAEDKNGFFRHTGVSNVNQRIKYEFGESYGLSIRSIPGQGTTTEFNLPFLESQSPEKEALDQKKEKQDVSTFNC